MLLRYILTLMFVDFWMGDCCYCKALYLRETAQADIFTLGKQIFVSGGTYMNHNEGCGRLLLFFVLEI